jgi:hypothetical protein
MKNLFDKAASKLELVKFKGPCYEGNLKAKTTLNKDGDLCKETFKVKRVTSICAIYNPDKDAYETDSEAFCERLITVEE